jgi:hypothetical protein
MKNQFKLLLVAATISLGIFACKGSVNTGDAGTTPQDSIKTGYDVNVDTVGKHTNIVVDTTKMNAPDTAKK